MTLNSRRSAELVVVAGAAAGATAAAVAAPPPPPPSSVEAASGAPCRRHPSEFYSRLIGGKLEEDKLSQLWPQHWGSKRRDVGRCSTTAAAAVLVFGGVGLVFSFSCVCAVLSLHFRLPHRQLSPFRVNLSIGAPFFRTRRRRASHDGCKRR